MEEVMSSGDSLVQETADSIDEVSLSQVPGEEKIFNKVFPEQPRFFPRQGFGVRADWSPSLSGKMHAIQILVR